MSGQSPARCFQKLSRFFGIVLGALSALLYSVSLVLFKKVEGMGSSEIVCIRSLLTVIFAAAYLLLKGEPPIILKNRYAWILGMTSIFGNYLYFAALLRLSFGDVNAILYSSPVIIGILAYFILKEPFGIFDFVITVVMVLGVIFVVQPTFLKTLFHMNGGVLYSNTSRIQHGSANDKNCTDIVANLTAFDCRNRSETSFNDSGFQLPRIYASIFAIVATITSSVSYIIQKKLTDINPTIIVCQFNLLIFIGGLPIVSVIERWRFPGEVAPWLWTIASTVTNLFGQVLYQLALRYDTATAVAIARTSEIPIAYVMQILIFHDIPNALSISGAVLVTGAVIVYCFRRYLNERKTTVEQEMKGLLEDECKTE